MTDLRGKLLGVGNEEGKPTVGDTPGKREERKPSLVGSTPTPSAIYGMYEEKYPSYSDTLHSEIQDPNPVTAKEVNNLVDRLKRAEAATPRKHVMEHMRILETALWEAQQAYDKLRSELGLDPLVQPTEDNCHTAARNDGDSNQRTAGSSTDLSSSQCLEKLPVGAVGATLGDTKTSR